MYDEFDRSFKDDLRADNFTYLNTDEFSELTWVDGVLMKCQVSHWTAEKSGRASDNYDGLHGDFTTIFFEASVYMKKRERLPREGEWIYINGKRYDVMRVKNEMGVAKVVCAAYRQNTLRPNPLRE